MVFFNLHSNTKMTRQTDLIWLEREEWQYERERNKVLQCGRERVEKKEGKKEEGGRERGGKW